MPVDIVVGGQYGSEGKGRVVEHLTSFALKKKTGHVHCVRCGGPNSGHGVTVNGQVYIFRQLPSGIHQPGTICYIPAGAVVNPMVLVDEISKYEELHGSGTWNPSRLIVDPRAVIISENEMVYERDIKESIGSTGSGNGQALIARMERRGEARLMGDTDVAPSVQGFTLSRVSPWLLRAKEKFEYIIIEGNQGYGLSLLHGPHYPYVTSRDVTASGFLSECGLPPNASNRVHMVIRTFPIRVGGNSGPLKNEVTWAKVAELGKWPMIEIEMTSVTKKVRRVGLFDMEMVKEAAAINGATTVHIMGADRFDWENYGKKSWGELTMEFRKWVGEVEFHTGCTSGLIGTSPTTHVVKGR